MVAIDLSFGLATLHTFPLFGIGRHNPVRGATPGRNRNRACGSLAAKTRVWVKLAAKDALAPFPERMRITCLTAASRGTATAAPSPPPFSIFCPTQLESREPRKRKVQVQVQPCQNNCAVSIPPEVRLVTAANINVLQRLGPADTTSDGTTFSTEYRTNLNNGY